MCKHSAGHWLKFNQFSETQILELFSISSLSKRPFLLVQRANLQLCMHFTLDSSLLQGSENVLHHCNVKVSLWPLGRHALGISCDFTFDVLSLSIAMYSKK